MLFLDKNYLQTILINDCALGSKYIVLIILLKE